MLATALLLAACAGDDRAGPTATPGSTSEPAPTASVSAQDQPALALARAFDGRRALETVRTLAEPSFMGRHVGTPGELRGAQFLADAFEEAGLEPGGDDGSFLQSFSMEVEELAAVPVLELSGGAGETRPLGLRDDFRPIYGGVAGAGDVTGPGLFVGHAENLAGLDVEGKVLLVVPRGGLGELAGRARDAGALAVIVTTGQATLFKGEGHPPDPGAIPMAEVSQSGAAALLGGSGHSREELNALIAEERPLPSFPLAWTVRLAVALQPPAEVEAHNVIGVVRGTSGTTSTVVVGAHYEEIGPDPDGVVFPAANDNASGTAVLVELARLLDEVDFRPHANVVFIAWSGHEEGLVGSKYYADHPLFPLTETSFYLNLDTVGQGAAPDLEAFPSGAEARGLLETGLELLRLASGRVPVGIRGSEDGEGVSDDRNFVEAGVPSVSLIWGGLVEDGRIHTPADTADTVDPDKLRVTGQLASILLVLASR